MTDVNVGDWVAFLRNATIVYAVVHYVKQDGFLPPTLITNLGEVAADRVLEVRPPKAPQLSWTLTTTSQPNDILKCCTGINGSHTAKCQTRHERLTCWCCGATFPAVWACGWSDNGARCMSCASHDTPGCRLHVGRRIEDVRNDK